MKKITKNLVGSLALLSLVTSCGDSGGSKSSDGGAAQEERSQGERIALDGSNIDGFYKAEFTTLNKHIVGTVPGSASFTRKEDKLYIYLRLFAGAPKAWHMQAVYTGNRCPTLNDDLNGDGFIDILEAQKVVGNVLIPLDSDPGTQASGRNFYPLGDMSGSYHYERIVNFKRFFSDLQAEDPNPDDNIVKLGPDKGLSLIGKVVMIQGVAQPTPEGTEMPEGQYPNPQVPEETVATYGRHRNWQTLPIACGVFQKEANVQPGSEWVNDQIPGPVGDVVDGQDQPAPSDTPHTTGSGTSGSSSGTGTNDSDDGNGPVSDGRTTSGTSGGTTGSTSGGTSTGSSSSGSTTGGTTGSGSTTGGGWWTSGGSGSGSTTGSTTSGSTTTGGTSGTPDYGDDEPSNTTTTTTSSSSSSSSSSGGESLF